MTFERVRQAIGRAILLGLEVRLIADIVLTITVDATLESALTLGLVVLVRTSLSFSWRSSSREPCHGAAPGGEIDRPIEDDDPGRRVPV